MAETQSESTDGSAPCAPAAGVSLREQYRRQMLTSIGGVSGMVVAGLPPLVFVAVNALAGLRWAVLAAVGSALLLAGYRLARRQPVQQALAGLLGVVVASAIAAGTGQARSYFLVGIVMSFGYSAAFGLSMLMRRPLVGVVWEFLDPSPLPASAKGGPAWVRSPLLRAYMLATLAGLAVFLSRGVVQLTLFRHNATGWLAVARLSMGYPLYFAAIAFAMFVVRRARRQQLSHALPYAGLTRRLLPREPAAVSVYTTDWRGKVR
jgi:hypothetical protein